MFTCYVLDILSLELHLELQEVIGGQLTTRLQYRQQLRKRQIARKRLMRH